MKKTIKELAEQQMPMPVYVALKLLHGYPRLQSKDQTIVGNLCVTALLEKRELTNPQLKMLMMLLKRYNLMDAYEHRMSKRDTYMFIPGRSEV